MDSAIAGELLDKSRPDAEILAAVARSFEPAEYGTYYDTGAAIELAHQSDEAYQDFL